MNIDRAIEIEIISSFEEFRQMHSSWNRLLEQSNNNKVFMTHEWFSSWWQAFGEGKALSIIKVKKRDEIIGLAPFMMYKSTFRGMPVRCIEFIENDDSPGCGFIIKQGHEQVSKSIISFLLKDMRNWDIISMKNMFFNEETHKSIEETLQKTKKRYIMSNGLSSPFIKAESGWEDFFNGLSTKSKKTIRNICNRIKRLENIEVRELKSTGNFDDIILITKKGWKYKEGKSFINRKDRERFFALLSDYAQHKGWLSLWCIYKDREPIAYEYHLKYNGSVVALLSEYNSDYKTFSPGAYLDYRIIESLFNNGYNEYDMCGVYDSYKQKWTRNTRDLENITIFNKSVYTELLFFLEEKLVPVFKKIRGSFIR